MYFYLELFFLIFGPKLIYGGFDVVLFVSILVIVKYQKKDINITNEIIILLSIFLFGLISILINETLQLILIFRYIRALVNVIAIRMFVIHYLKEKSITTFINQLNWVIAVHALIMLFEVISPSFHEVIIQISGERRGKRVSGLTAGFGTTSMILMTPLINKFIFKKINIIPVIISVIGCSFSGRIGFYLAIIAIPIIIIVKIIFKEYSFKRVVSTLIILLVLYYTLTTIAFSFYKKEGVIYDFFDNQPVMKVTTYKALEPIINYYESGELTTTSSEQVLEMQFLYNNNTYFEHIFGTGNTGREKNENYLPTDIGYALLFNSLGILGVVLSVLFYLKGVFIHRRDIRNPIYHGLLILVFFSLVGNYKQTIMFTRNFFSIYMIYESLLYVKNRKKMQINLKN